MGRRKNPRKKKRIKIKKNPRKKKRRKPDEPELFAPVLKIKMEAPPSEPSTPKLVIKNIPKEPPKPAEQDPVPLLGFQPLRQGPARTHKTDGPVRTPKSTPGKVEKNQEAKY